MELLLSDLAEKVDLLEGGEWDPAAVTMYLPARVSARRVVPARKSIKVHLGSGIHHGHDEGHLVSWGPIRTYYHRLRNRAIELTGPLTARQLLHAIGDAQLFECTRNWALSTWLDRHAEDDSDDLDIPKRPIDCIPLNMEYFKQFQSKTQTVQLPDGTSKTTSVPPTPICVLDPPADVDPTAGMNLQAIMDLMGGEMDAFGYLSGGSTNFLGLQPVPGPLEPGRAEEWVATWSETFA